MRRVLIIGNNLLMGASLESLLSQDKYLEVSGIACTNQINLLQEVEQFHPDAVVLTDFCNPVKMIGLVDLLKLKNNLRIVGVSLESNLVVVFDQQPHQITEITDFLKIIYASEFQNARFCM